jgi:ABC-type phosphate transport system substrate-binding protein
MKFAFVTLAVLVLGAAALASEKPATGVVVILHPSNGTSALDRSQLAQILKGVRKSWNAQLRISIVLPPSDSAAMATLASEIFKVPRPEDVRTYYANAVNHKIFSAPPVTASSSEEVVRRVAAEPGALAVIDVRAVGPDAPVKVIAVDGL